MQTRRTSVVVTLLAMACLLAGLGGPAFGEAAGFKGLTKETVREMYMDHLREEGYSPEIDSDGDIKFKKEGEPFYVIFDDDDLEFLKIARANFWSVESAAERLEILEAADHATRRTKVAKVYLNSDEDNTWASAEMYLSGPDQFALIFKRSLSALRAAVGKFADKMRE